MRFSIYILILTAMFIDCQSNQRGAIKNLTDYKGKYWDVVRMSGFYEKDSSRVYPLFCYYFDTNGRRIFYQYNKGKREEYRTDDVVIPATWKNMTDSTIVLGGVLCKIEKLTKDTFIYSSQYRRVVLSKASN